MEQIHGHHIECQEQSPVHRRDYHRATQSRSFPQCLEEMQQHGGFLANPLSFTRNQTHCSLDGICPSHMKLSQIKILLRRFVAHLRVAKRSLLPKARNSHHK
ncbi:hypothetical protein V8G54_011438 [Vigna mungo]|uniref:Uncharacterized protein n=1 Tax=Vigna mungo TaxID=3915 RepID=A0AAQ3NRK8_VIGMU